MYRILFAREYKYTTQICNLQQCTISRILSLQHSNTHTTTKKKAPAEIKIVGKCFQFSFASKLKFNFKEALKTENVRLLKNISGKGPKPCKTAKVLNLDQNKQG